MRLTSPLWYLVAVAIALGGSMIGTAVAAQAWDGVRDATITPVTAPIEASGKTLAIFTDQSQTDREITCVTRPADQPDATGTTIREASLDIVVDNRGTDWHLLALQDGPKGSVTVACTPSDGAADTASYGFAVVDGFDKADQGARIGTIALVAGLGWAAVVFWMRRRAKRLAPTGKK